MSYLLLCFSFLFSCQKAASLPSLPSTSDSVATEEQPSQSPKRAERSDVSMVSEQPQRESIPRALDSPPLTAEETRQRIIRQVMLLQKNSQSCSAQSSPPAKGEIQLEFLIHTDGKVYNSKVLLSSVEDQKVIDCVVQIFRSGQFLKPPNGETMKMTGQIFLSP